MPPQTPASMPPAALLAGANAAFLDAQYVSWLEDPSSVGPDWAALFAAWSPREAMSPGPLPGALPVRSSVSIFAGGGHGLPATTARMLEAADRQAKVDRLINAYRVRGHCEADLDPLGRKVALKHPELSLGFYGLAQADLDVPVSGRNCFGVPEVTTARHIIDRLRRAYCGNFGVEFMNIGEPDQKAWLQERLECLQDTEVLSREEERQVLHQLCDAENFERLVHNRFPGTKRFSLEGAETLIPLLDRLIEAIADAGVDDVVLGMAHRGRLNVLVNVLGKPVRDVIDEFEDVVGDSFQGSGDVKYHLGYTNTYTTWSGKAVELSLAFNPSHLEAVNPVVEGRVRARQDRRGEGAAHHVLPLLIHGDAAFAGQGLVCETLNLSQLRGYGTGGTVHVVINNQIGFTTGPKDARSTPYCTDVARMLAVPIFHVNGEDPVAVTAVARLAAAWRQTFHQDVVIDMYCFRRHGHNEGDEPSFTQPLMYGAIRSHPTPRVLYGRRMVEQGHLAQADVDQLLGESMERLEHRLQNRPSERWGSYTGNTHSSSGKRWAQYDGSLHDPVDTRVDRARLVALLECMTELPEGFEPHRKVKRLLGQRREIAAGERPVDWAVAEAAAYATLVDDGFGVRLSGQDCGRGTFSHRHAVLTDVRDGREYLPLDHLPGAEARVRVFDSLLSEAAVLGFEFGYTLESPDDLVIWEAQFGDFANGAQVIIDNFLMATEQKWNRMSGLVMLLPHGYEGQGPEHSSARLERYLQLCAEDNVVVANCTTPNNFFHLLRRQMLQRVRKPLVVMSPKSLLRHPACVCTLDDLAAGAFQPLLDDAASALAPERVDRVVFCSGKIFYELEAAREAADAWNVALVRLERLHPFPAAEVAACLGRFPGGVEVVWCQEEPRNMGAWPMMDEWMGELLGGQPPRYIGRKRAASPATGSPKKHRFEQSRLIQEALGLGSGGTEAEA